MAADPRPAAGATFRATCPRCRTRMERGARVCDCGEDAFEQRRAGEERGPLEGRYVVTELRGFLHERGSGGCSYMVVDTLANRRVCATFRTEDYERDSGRARQLADNRVSVLNARPIATTGGEVT